MAGLLSGGEQQMLAIGRALMSRPRLLMLDEPSLGLAPMAIARVYDKLTAIRSRGVAILVAEQNAARAFAVADRVLIMSHGRFSLSGRPDEIRGASRFRRRLFWRDDERRELVRMREAAQVFIDAISVGGLYALTALGIGMIFGVMRLVNFRPCGSDHLRWLMRLFYFLPNQRRSPSLRPRLPPLSSRS